MVILGAQEKVTEAKFCQKFQTLPKVQATLTEKNPPYMCAKPLSDEGQGTGMFEGCNNIKQIGHRVEVGRVSTVSKVRYM